MSFIIKQECNTLSNLKQRYPLETQQLLLNLPDDTAVKIRQYTFGESIIHTEKPDQTNNDDNYTLSIILVGEVELMDMSRFENVFAYRPIKILKEGHAFGDFSIIDSMLGINITSRPVESWQLVAGRRCFLSDQKVDDAAGLNLPAPETKEFFEAFNFKSMQHNIEIAEISIPKTTITQAKNAQDFLSANFLFGRDLLAHAWIGAKAYRDSINSFNFSLLLEFRYRAGKWAQRYGTEGATNLQKDVQKRILLELFCDALFDAINRPLREEPLFQLGLPAWIKKQGVEKLALYGMMEQNVLSACSCFSGREFFFPLDLHNIFINQVLSFEYLSLRSPEARANLIKKINKLFPTELAKEDPVPLKFYMDLTEHMIAKYNNDPTYPYFLKCLRKYGAIRPMLLLQYKRKTHG